MSTYAGTPFSPSIKEPCRPGSYSAKANINGCELIGCEGLLIIHSFLAPHSYFEYWVMIDIGQRAMCALMWVDRVV